MQRLSEHLERLKLNQVKEMLPALMQQAHADKLSYMDFLSRLLEEEVNARESRRVNTALKIAGLPYEKTLLRHQLPSDPSLVIQYKCYEF